MELLLVLLAILGAFAVLGFTIDSCNKVGERLKRKHGAAEESALPSYEEAVEIVQSWSPRRF